MPKYFYRDKSTEDEGGKVDTLQRNSEKVIGRHDIEWDCVLPGSSTNQWSVR